MSLKIKSALKRWEVSNLVKACKIGREVATSNNLPFNGSLSNLWDKHETAFTSGIVDFAQRGNQVAAEILKLIQPTETASTLPKNDGWQSMEQPTVSVNVSHTMSTKDGNATFPIEVKGLSFFADVLSKDGKAAKYTVATVIYLGNTDKLMGLIGKTAVVVKHNEKTRYFQRQCERLRHLQDRILSPNFMESLKKNGQLSIVDIREFSPTAGSIDQIFSFLARETAIVDMVLESLVTVKKGLPMNLGLLS